MNADLMRRAADEMREFETPWTPAVAVAVANWLDWQAHLEDHWDTEGGSCAAHARDVARAYLGGDA